MTKEELKVLMDPLIGKQFNKQIIRKYGNDDSYSYLIENLNAGHNILMLSYKHHLRLEGEILIIFDIIAIDLSKFV